MIKFIKDRYLYIILATLLLTSFAAMLVMSGKYSKEVKKLELMKKVYNKSMDTYHIAGTKYFFYKVDLTYVFTTEDGMAGFYGAIESIYDDAYWEEMRAEKYKSLEEKEEQAKKEDEVLLDS